MANTTAISYTAPQFTEDDMRREEENLSQEERLEIENDVYGKQAIRRETAQTLSEGIAELQRALDTIDSKDKQVYLEALEHCPGVVRVESDPILFLRCENYNGQVGAFGNVLHITTVVTVFSIFSILHKGLTFPFSSCL
jgi:hypothetical protein